MLINSFSPLVSIIIPVYNGSNYIFFALDSCIKQTYRNIEIIIVNDGSTDNGLTEFTILPFLNDKRVKYYFKDNGGVSSALNYGFSRCNGEYISWLSHDDYFSNDKIEKQIAHIAKSNKIISYTQTIPVSSSANKINFFHRFFINKSLLKRKNIQGPTSYFKNKLPFYGSLLIPRSFFEKHPFNSDLRYGQDIFSIFEMLIDTDYAICYCKNGKTFYRIHNESGNFTRTNDYINEQYTKNNLYLHYILKNPAHKKLLKLYFYSNCRLAAHYSINKNIVNLIKPIIKKECKYASFIFAKGRACYLLFRFLWKLKRLMMN